MRKRLAILAVAAILGSIMAAASSAQACGTGELPPIATGGAVFAAGTAVVGAGGEAACWSGGGSEWNITGAATASCNGNVVTISNATHSNGGASSISFDKSTSKVSTPNGVTDAVGTFTSDCAGAFAFVTAGL